MPLKDHDKRAALADRYGRRIIGWAVSPDNPAGISLTSLRDSTRFLRFQHSDSLATWKTVLSETTNPKPEKVKRTPKPMTFDDVVAENKKLRAEIKRLKKAKR